MLKKCAFTTFSLRTYTINNILQKYIYEKLSLRKPMEYVSGKSTY